MMGIIAHIVQAAAEGHDNSRLETEMDRLVASVWIGLQKTPDGLSKRLQQLVLTGQKLKIMDVDDFIDAVKSVSGDPVQQADVAALELVAARLGSEMMAMRIGRKIFEELRESRALSPQRLP